MTEQSEAPLFPLQNWISIPEGCFATCARCSAFLQPGQSCEHLRCSLLRVVVIEGEEPEHEVPRTLAMIYRLYVPSDK